MKKTIAIYLLTLSMLTSCAQNNKTISGYYNLSEFEMPASLSLLDNGQFYYSAIFGAVDLEIYGTYTIEDNSIIFHPKDEQMQPFGLYGREDKTLTNEVEFFYYKPNEDYRYNVVFSLDDNWVKNTEEQENKTEVYFKTKHRHLKALKIGYPTLFNKTKNYFKVSQGYKATIPSKNNSFILTFNRYYFMRKQFASAPTPLDGENILQGEKVIKKQEIPKGEAKKIAKFIDEHQIFKNSIVVKEKTYKKITQIVDNANPKLKLTTNGELEEISQSAKNWKQTNSKYYTISYPENWTNDIYNQKSIEYNMIASPENISGVEINISNGNLNDLEDMVEEIRNKTKEMPNIVLKIKKKSSDNLKYELKLKDKTKEGEVLARYYFKNNKIIKVIAHNIPKYQSIISKMLKSFKLK